MAPNIVVIKSPMVGTFYSRPNPKAEPYVKVGDRVDPNTIVCIIEAMKVFNEIPAEVRGQDRRGPRRTNGDSRSSSSQAACSTRRIPQSDVSTAMFQRILIANRGEIALRIIRACRELGIETVAVYQRGRPRRQYLELADEAICIGPAKAAESYLKIDRIISAAEVGNVEAIHPGYGFLAENAHFAEVCRSCKIEFIGPTPRGDGAARRQERGPRDGPRRRRCPSCPAATGLIDRRGRGGRGRPRDRLSGADQGDGRRRRQGACASPANDLALKTALAAGRSRGRGGLRNAGVYLEKYIEQPRHVEVQILADQHGNVVHLWERDCSHAAAPSEADRGKPRAPACRSETRDGHLRGGRAAGQGGRLHERRHRRVPRRSRTTTSTSSRSTPASRSSTR